MNAENDYTSVPVRENTRDRFRKEAKRRGVRYDRLLRDLLDEDDTDA